MRVLIVGGGGREHALAWKIRRSPLVSHLYCAPGNAGIASVADCVPIEPADIVEIADFASKVKVDLTVVGPEIPLHLGLADELAKRGLPAFGPRRNAAEIESSKVFAKDFMIRNGIPTADFKVFRREEEALAHVADRSTPFPLVVKADGLAAGKGVVVAESRGEAEGAIRSMMGERSLGASGDAVIVEECLRGTEVSVFAICDGARLSTWTTCQDFKRALDGDQGPNTGGMGGYSPSAYLDSAALREVVQKVLTPAVAGMAREGRPYQGILYAGVMLTERGPMVLEFNCRLGDPEAESILPRMKSDIVPQLAEAAAGSLPADRRTEWTEESAVTVVVASGGYPGSYVRGKAIHGLDEAAAVPDTVVFHAGTGRVPTGEIQTSGGRVLAVTSLGETLRLARERCYEAVSRIRFEGMQYRTDIASRAVETVARGREERA